MHAERTAVVLSESAQAFDNESLQAWQITVKIWPGMQAQTTVTRSSKVRPRRSGRLRLLGAHVWSAASLCSLASTAVKRASQCENRSATEDKTPQTELQMFVPTVLGTKNF